MVLEWDHLSVHAPGHSHICENKFTLNDFSGTASSFWGAIYYNIEVGDCDDNPNMFLNNVDDDGLRQPPPSETPPPPQGSEAIYRPEATSTTSSAATSSPSCAGYDKQGLCKQASGCIWDDEEDECIEPQSDTDTGETPIPDSSEGAAVAM